MKRQSSRCHRHLRLAALAAPPWPRPAHPHRRGDAAVGNLCRHRPAGEVGPGPGRTPDQRRRRHRRPADRADLRRRGSQPGRRRAEGREAVPGQQGGFPDRHRELRRHPGRGAGGRAQQPPDRHHRFLRRQHHRRQVLAQRLPRQCAGRHAVRCTGRLDGGTKPNANVFYLGPDYEMGRSTVAAFKSAAEGKGAKSVWRGVRAAGQQGLLALLRPDALAASRR
jgi:hypothetical protein